MCSMCDDQIRYDNSDTPSLAEAPGIYEARDLQIVLMVWAGYKLQDAAWHSLMSGRAPFGEFSPYA